MGLGSVKQVYFGLFWTAYADWIYTVVSLSGLLLICWLVLGRPSQR
ncbi:MAG: adenylosuccinate lyase [Cyanobium sp. SAT1300]|nr:adenylosuccinate lyase [Cyanobium sp. SAT1300]